MYHFQQSNDTPVMPIANHDDDQDATDENIRLQNCALESKFMPDYLPHWRQNNLRGH